MGTTSFNLSGRIALITGASRGMGEAIAATFCGHGATCILASRKIGGLNEAAARITEHGGTAIPAACHVGDLIQIDALMTRIESEFGRLDILVNNAAANPQADDMLHATDTLWDKIFDVNLKGPFFLTQRAARLMLRGKRGGSIINIASIDGLRPSPDRGVYAISKAGVIAMTKALAAELAPKNVRVNAILPGLFKTHMAKGLFDDSGVYAMHMRNIPMGRHAEPSEVVGAALYFASDASSYTTGALLTVDGGQVL